MSCAKVAGQIEITETAWAGRRLASDRLHQAESDVGSFDTPLDMCRGFTTLALALEVSGKTTEAISFRRTMSRLFPDDANQHFRLFYLLHRLKHDDDAIHELCLGLTQSGFAPLASRIQTESPTIGVSGAVQMVLRDPVISHEDDHW